MDASAGPCPVCVTWRADGENDAIATNAIRIQSFVRNAAEAFR